MSERHPHPSTCTFPHAPRRLASPRLSSPRSSRDSRSSRLASLAALSPLSAASLARASHRPPRHYSCSPASQPSSPPPHALAVAKQTALPSRSDGQGSPCDCGGRGRACRSGSPPRHLGRSACSRPCFAINACTHPSDRAARLE